MASPLRRLVALQKPSVRCRLLATMVCMCGVLVGRVEGQSSKALPTWRIPDAPAELRAAISRRDVIIAAMHDALLWELNSGLEQGGPLLAIKSCHIDSARVAQRVGREEGVAAGRTSDRLRNPTNAPKAWAAPLVTANAGRRAKDVAGFAVDLGDKEASSDPSRCVRFAEAATDDRRRSVPLSALSSKIGIRRTARPASRTARSEDGTGSKCPNRDRANNLRFEQEARCDHDIRSCPAVESSCAGDSGVRVSRYVCA